MHTVPESSSLGERSQPKRTSQNAEGMGRTRVLVDVTEQWDYATLDPIYLWTSCYKSEKIPLLFRSLLFGFFATCSQSTLVQEKADELSSDC